MFVGSRYGGAIYPQSIEADEFELLVSYTEDECVNILHHWYQLDDNAVPPVYILKVKGLSGEIILRLFILR